MDLVEFVEKILDIKPTPSQKEMLYIIQKESHEKIKYLYKRGQVKSPYYFGWIYKEMWKHYNKTGEIKFPFDCIDNNEENFKREYECKW